MQISNQRLVFTPPPEGEITRTATISAVDTTRTRLDVESAPSGVRLVLTNSTTVTATRYTPPPLRWYQFYARVQRWRMDRRPIRLTVKEYE